MEFDEEGYVVKKTVALLMISLMLFSLVSCSVNKLEKPETNLEFWIGENVDDVDFSTYQEKYRYGFMGSGRQYYGTGYAPTTDENGQQLDPEYCVIYTVAPFPDYTSRKCHITEIYISDPDVNIYGLTINSSNDDIESTMKNNGFESVEIGNVGYKEWVKGKYHIQFLDGYIGIGVDVSNFWKIQF